ncbi:ankyrin repeat domain-containing protein [Fulvivirga sp. M361]|uniref:ankyrin repeat domain-containing protein n=1 Tax=Fulvivirga sp. M361 TaxID=2594266 RepID=UPI001179CDC7|nr:ankyrin repeat domain-containing protein [Fulvivirga sp. M361]TRX62598.1 ankyrin repeat domain-containing protein [Fulvivirga sp. M361]
MDRKLFIKTGITASLGLSALPIFTNARWQTDPEPLKTATVKEFVVAGHKDLNKVKEMLTDHPNLIYSRYDWGNGDFEEAIEGAGHLGNKEIARYLIAQGARVNLMVLTMLGKTDLVKPVLEEYPELLFSKGAHGFTLLHHAKVGGEEAKELYAYLTERGLTKTNIKIR